MSKIPPATFNCENLFARYKFEKAEVDIETLFEMEDPVSKDLTGKVIDGSAISSAFV